MMCRGIAVGFVGLCVVCAVVLTAPARAQAETKYPVVTSTLQPTSATVGQQLKLSLNIVVPELTRISVKAPFVDAKDTTWTAVAKPAIVDEQLGSNEWRRHIDYTIASFEIGDIPAPKVEVTYQPPGSSEPVTRSTPDEIVHINSLLPANAEKVNLRDIKPPMPLPYPRWIFWTIAGVVAALVALAAFLIWRRVRGRVGSMFRPPLALDEWALSEIDRLEKDRLIEHKKTKELYTRLSDTVRQYYGKLLRFPSMDMTSGELLFQLEDIESEQRPENVRSFHDARMRTKEMLDEADLVKFAKFIPDPAQSRHAIEKAREVIRLTRYKLQPEPEQQGSGTSAPPPLPPAPPAGTAPQAPRQEPETQTFRPAAPVQSQGARVD
jgi:hypothetical protein